jgi:hypothetical protein
MLPMLCSRFVRSISRVLGLAAVVLVASQGGCCGDDTQETHCLDWPEQTSCPAPELAGFYMTGFAGDGECGIQLVSVDGAAAQSAEHCCYPITRTCEPECL